MTLNKITDSVLNSDKLGILSGNLNDFILNVKRPPGTLTAAQGDGVTDDTTVIQNIINSLTNGGTILFPYGSSFLISSSLKISSNNIRLIGYGARLFSNSSINLLDIQQTASHVDVYGLEMYKTTSLTGAMVYVESGSKYVTF